MKGEKGREKRINRKEFELSLTDILWQMPIPIVGTKNICRSADILCIRVDG